MNFDRGNLNGQVHFYVESLTCGLICDSDFLLDCISLITLIPIQIIFGLKLVHELLDFAL